MTPWGGQDTARHTKARKAGPYGLAVGRSGVDAPPILKDVFPATDEALSLFPCRKAVSMAVVEGRLWGVSMQRQPVGSFFQKGKVLIAVRVEARQLGTAQAAYHPLC